MPEWCPPATAERFWRQVDRSAGLFACWPWTGHFNRPSEAGRKKWGGGQSARPRFRLTWQPDVKVYAHRMALALTDGVPLWDREGLEGCHRPGVCDNPACCNPAHLYWGTAEENRRDRYGDRGQERTVAELREVLGEL